jgi:uncharacterized SAM-binding protein YcdF (DUF218 family)
MARFGRWLIRVSLFVAMLAVLWIAGFAWFINRVTTERPASPMPRTDGIVVLTGGADRVRAGLRLLVQGAAPRLLISGAGAGTDLADFTPRGGVDARAEATHITLGHAAHSTRGNARETAIWVTRHHLRSVVLVTADYHMPRALLELRRHLPGVKLIADPVRPPAMAHLARFPALRVLAGEFCKYLLVRLRLGGFAAHHVKSLL